MAGGGEQSLRYLSGGTSLDQNLMQASCGAPVYGVDVLLGYNSLFTELPQCSCGPTTAPVAPLYDPALFARRSPKRIPYFCFWRPSPYCPRDRLALLGIGRQGAQLGGLTVFAGAGTRSAKALLWTDGLAASVRGHPLRWRAPMLAR